MSALHFVLHNSMLNFLCSCDVFHLVGLDYVQREGEANAQLGAASCLSPPCSRSPGTPDSTSTLAPSPSCMKSYTWA